MRRRPALGALLAVLLLVLLQGSASASSSVTLAETELFDTPIKVVAIDLRDPGVKISLALCDNFPRGSERFSRMVERSQATAAITGTFFDVRTRRPVGDLVEDGNLRYFGGFGTALAVTPGNQVSILRVPRGRHIRWWNAETVMMTGPTLLRSGAIVVNPRAEGFRSVGLGRSAARAAVGVTKSGKMLFVATGKPITLGALSKIMQALGCRDAINLDGGTSTALAYRGKVLIAPGRGLVNLLTAREHVPPGERFIYPGVPYDERSLAEAQDEMRLAEAKLRGQAYEEALDHSRRAFLAAPWNRDARRFYHRCQDVLQVAHRRAEELLLLGSLMHGQGRAESARALTLKALDLYPRDPGTALLPLVLERGKAALRSDGGAMRRLLASACPLADGESVAGMIDRILQQNLSFSPTEDSSLYLQMKRPPGPFEGRTIRLGAFCAELPPGWTAEPSPRDGAVMAWHPDGKAVLTLREFVTPEQFSLYRFAQLFGEHTELGTGTIFIGKERGAAVLSQEWKRTMWGVDLAIFSRFVRAGGTLYVVSLAGPHEARDILGRELSAMRLDW